MNKRKILISDDHPIFRNGLKQVLSDMLDIRLVDEACTSKETVDKVMNNDYSLLILDITMPGNDGLDLLKEVRSMKPQLPVLVLSMHSEKEYGIRVIRAGGYGYLNKANKAKDLVQAVKKVMSGSKYITSTIAEELAYDFESNRLQVPANMLFSDRQYQVLRLIANGKTTNEIAKQLSLSKSTVYSYRKNILEKARVRNNAELIRYATRNKLVDITNP